MNRREFTNGLGRGAITLGLGGIHFSGTASPVKDHPRIAVTMDDFNWKPSLKLRSQERNRAILDALIKKGPGQKCEAHDSDALQSAQRTLSRRPARHV